MGEAMTAINDLPPGFKMTEIGLLPEEWEVEPLGPNLSLIRNGLTSSQNREGKGIPVTRIETISDDGIDAMRVRFVEGLTEGQISRNRLICGDILFSHINSEPQIGRSVMYQGEPPVLLHGMNLLRIRPDESKYDSAFLNFLFQHLRLQGVFISLAARAVGQSSINQGKIKALRALRPPLPEQRCIAAVLTAMRRAIEATNKVIAATKELKKSLMRHLFTYGPVPYDQADQVPLKETQIGPMPEGWEVATVGQLGKVVTGTTPRTAVSEYYGGSYMFITPGDVSEGRYVSRTEKSLSEAGLRVSRVLPRDTVLVVCIGATIGKTGMTLAERSASNQQINAIIPDQEVVPAYLYYAVTHRSRDLPSLAGRAAVPIVNKANFSEFTLPLAGSADQQEIALTLAAADEMVKVQRDRKSALESLFKTMLHLLMTGQVRVKDLELPVEVAA